MHFNIADHLVVSRGFYSHHGLYLGGNLVIHNDDEEGVEIVPLASFSKGKKIMIKPYAKCFPANEVIARAKSRLNEDNYSLFSNNCEHFVSWCKTGINQSQQVKKTTKTILDLLSLDKDFQEVITDLLQIADEPQALILTNDRKRVELQSGNPGENNYAANKLPNYLQNQSHYSEFQKIMEFEAEVKKELDQMIDTVDDFFDGLIKVLEND